MLRWLSCTTLVLLAACSRSPDAPPVVRLVDVFDSATVEGSSDARPSPARTEWRFDSENHGWTALSPILPSSEAQTYTVTPGSSIPSSAIRHLMLRPTDEAGAESRSNPFA